MASTIWKGRLNFGLVSIPIKLSRAARAEKIHMHKIQRETGNRVRQVFVPRETAALPEPAPELPEQAPGKIPPSPVPTSVAKHAVAEPAPLSRDEIVQGFQYEKDRYVQFEPEELAQIAPRSSPDMQILEFVKFAEIDPVYLETSYCVAPDAGGDKPYALLFETLKKSGYAAIGEFVMHRRDQILVLRPGKHGLIAHTMFYVDEVKSQNEYHSETDAPRGKEMELALKLVDAMAGEFDPEKFKDQYRERLRQAIAQKIEGAPVQPEAPPSKKPVVDIMAALQESLSRVKKPAARESRPATGKKTKRA
jgi:DNA end-binding protein Ku